MGVRNISTRTYVEYVYVYICVYIYIHTYIYVYMHMQNARVNLYTPISPVAIQALPQVNTRVAIVS